ncbi:MAG: hypothetical protein ACKOAU_15540, partial [Pirellula sp.]
MVLGGLTGCAITGPTTGKRIPREAAAIESQVSSDAAPMAPASQTAESLSRTLPQKESFAVPRTPSAVGPQYVETSAP